MVFFWLTLLWRLYVQCLQVVQDTCRPITMVTYCLLLITPCYANTFFNICLCIILNKYFLTDCLTAIYYIMLCYFYFTLICVLPFFTLLLAHHKPGEGRVLSRTHISDSYPWLRSETYEISDRSIKLNNEYWSFSHTFHLHTYVSSIIIDYTIFAFPSGSCR